VGADFQVCPNLRRWHIHVHHSDVDRLEYALHAAVSKHVWQGAQSIYLAAPEGLAWFETQNDLLS
jgi:hypothetical protein